MSKPIGFTVYEELLVMDRNSLESVKMLDKFTKLYPCCSVCKNILCNSENDCCVAERILKR
jgi:hypothetical protein